MKRHWLFTIFIMLCGAADPIWAADSAEGSCNRTIKAHVIALDQPYLLNRLGASVPGGIIYALREDVVSLDTPIDENGHDVNPGQLALMPGNVRLRTGKRPRPIVIRANKGDCIEITFTNCLTQDANYTPPGSVPLPSSLQTSERQIGFHIAGLNVVNIESLSSFTGTNPNSYSQPGNPDTVHVPDSSSAAPGETRVLTWYAEEEGAFFIYSKAGETSHINVGLFGMCNVQPEGAEWYRSQVTHDDLIQATLHLDDLAGRFQEIEPLTDRFGDQLRDLEGNLLWTLTSFDPESSLVRTATVTVRGNRIYTEHGQPVIDYQARYRGDHPHAGKPVLSMLDGDRLVYSDLTAIITGPDASRFPFSQDSPSFFENPASPDRRQPYREITIIYHMPSSVVQSFVQFVDPATVNVFDAGQDQFGINYGVAGIGPEIVANRLGVGPMGSSDSVDLKFEEFFLSSWAVGDPAMVVDVPANAPNDVVSNPADGEQLLPNVEPVNCDLAYDPLNFRKATIAYYADDPSNVYHSYMRDHVKFRIANAGGGQPHVHHQHAHQWLHSPNSDDSHYLDSQLIIQGATYTLEMVYNGSGNRNQTVGDSIFHCHFYPHFARGMWSLWRVHDVFEMGTILNPDGSVKWFDNEGNRINNRALPDGEIVTGTPIPAIVPLPTIAMAPIPARVELTPDGRRSITIPTVYPNGWVEFENPGFPFFIPGLAGSRAPHPPLDFAWAENPDGTPKLHESGAKKGRKILLDGGLPRHLVFGGNIVREFHTRWDFTKDFVLYDDEDKSNKNRVLIAGGLRAFELPEEGTAVEKAAMRAHATRTHPSFLPNGDPGNFILNGLPPVNGAPYAEPSVNDDGDSIWNIRRYQGANIQLDVVFNKSGWHYPQQRIITLWDDVAPTISGERPPEPFFFRSNTGDTVEYWHTNLVPNYYEMDDFQVRTPTDVLGQHIHLVKFDVTSSDGAANGFNYEDGTFSPDEVRERIDAVNFIGGLFAYDPVTMFADPDRQFLLKLQPYTEFYPFFGPEPEGQNWDGAQTTIQRWDTDPLLNDLGEDRTLRTVFTHDHFSPSTHQQTGLYAGMVVEPEDSEWFTNGPMWAGDAMGNTVFYPAGTKMNTRPDGGPTSWQAYIVGAGDEVTYREFMLEFQDTALAYGANSKGEVSEPITPLFTIPTCNRNGTDTGVGLTNTWSPGRATVVGIIAALRENPPILSEALRDQFSRQGITLSDNATIEAELVPDVPPTTCWIITDPLVLDTTDSSDVDVDEMYSIKIVTDLTCNGNDYGFEGLAVRVLTMTPGWADTAPDGTSQAINPPTDRNHPDAPPYPRLVSKGGEGTQTLNYRNEPVPFRVDTGTATDSNPNATNLAYAFSSIKRQDDLLNRQPDTGGPISTTDPPANDFTFPDHPLVPIGDAPGDVHDYDPYTPVLRAYEGDRVQVRTLVGAHVSQLSFTIHANRWYFEPSYTDSGYKSTQHMGISEHFEMLMRMPGSANTHYPGAPVDASFSDYLYQPNSDFTGVTNGMWGLLRTYDGSDQIIEDLPLLPNNPSGTGTEFDWASVADTFQNTDPGDWPTNYRSFTVHASNQTITYNTRGQTETNSDPSTGTGFTTYPDSDITQTEALVYTLTDETTRAGSASFSYDNAPLILRAAAGDFIEIVLVNDFDASDPIFSTQVAASTPFGSGAAPPVEMNVSTSAGLNAQLVSYDVTSSDGTNVGFNQYQTASPDNTVRYYWYAGKLVQADGEVHPVPVEYGAVTLLPADTLLQFVPGLIGAMVIEPENSHWDVDTDAPWSATVMDENDNVLFRDFVAIFQELPVSSNQTLASYNDQGDPDNPANACAAYNYRSEPQGYRNATADDADTYSNSIVGGQNPQIPIFRVPAGCPFRIRHTMPGGDCQNSFFFEGHGWQEEPYIQDSEVIGDNIRSQFFGTQQFVPNEQFNVVVDSAGGAFGVVGDYEISPYLQDGLGGWMLVRAEEETVTVSKSGMEDGNLVFSGHVLSQGELSKTLTLEILTPEGVMTSTAPVEPTTGRWRLDLEGVVSREGSAAIITTEKGARHVAPVNTGTSRVTSERSMDPMTGLNE